MMAHVVVPYHRQDLGSYHGGGHPIISIFKALGLRRRKMVLVTFDQPGLDAASYQNFNPNRPFDGQKRLRHGC